MHKLSTGPLASEPSRFAQTLMNRATRPVLVASPEARATALSKSKFARLPQEPEDVRITGLTRSLTRRLLALNLSGTLKPQPIAFSPIVQAKIA